ncbi:MAG: S-adenosylmethionine:tRNA ribosyltransferase-isomerase [Actinomycetota bacterium]|nr:S-adenosylmethionine:tRNA ribosyltransferase-isomerase [Actinomycetota bacterium]
MSSLLISHPLTRFAIPDGSLASEPAEYRGLQRDEVRLLAGIGGALVSRRFRDLPDLLDPGDLLVVNTSPTLPAALEGELGRGNRQLVHVSTPLPGGDWVIEIRLADNSGPDLGHVVGTTVSIPGGRTLRLLAPYPDPCACTTRLWRAAVSPGMAHAAYLRRYGRPITYGHQPRRFELADYQTLYAVDADSEPIGSAEMASAGRPFSTEVLIRAMVRGIAVAPIVLHAGVASPESHEPPMPERFAVPAVTGRMVEATRAAGGRVVAVGTTVVRALETAARPDGKVPATQGWTDLVLGPERRPRVVGGLITGLHEPEASHLLLLEAVVGPELVGQAYAAAVEEGYLWHEFGDSMLLIPE